MRQSEYFTATKDFVTLGVSDLMETDVVTCESSTDCRSAADKMIKAGCGGLPVVESGNELVGIVSDVDLLHVLKEGRDLKDVPVSEVMNNKFIAINQDSNENDLIEIFETSNAVRVPVLDKGHLVGIVSRRDVLFGFMQATAPHWHF